MTDQGGGDSAPRASLDWQTRFASLSTAAAAALSDPRDPARFSRRPLALMDDGQWYVDPEPVE